MAYSRNAVGYLLVQQIHVFGEREMHAVYCNVYNNNFLRHTLNVYGNYDDKLNYENKIGKSEKY